MKKLYSGPDLLFIVCCYLFLPLLWAMAASIAYAYAMDILEKEGYLE